MRANLTRARALADGASAELRAECDALVSQIEGELRANGVDVDDPRRAIAATKPPAAPAALRKEPPVSTKKTSNTDTPIVRAHATVNGCIQTFHVARSANDVLRETFATKQTALSAVHRAERHVEGCRENVRAYEAALRAAVEDVEIALEVANAHTALAGNVRRRIGHSTEYSPAKLAQLEAQAGESAAAVRTKRDAMNRAISQHEAAMSALRDAEKALVTARASAPR